MNECGISKLDLKRRNRMQILRVIREQGPISRVDISAALQITRAAVTIITNEMIEQHILQEVGEEPLDPGTEIKKGRRKVLLDINETYRFAIGVYIDEQIISIGLTTLYSAALDKKTIPHDGTITAAETAEMITMAVQKMLQNSCLSMEDLIGIGIGLMPSMYSAMQCEMTMDGTMSFAELQWEMEQHCEAPIYVGDALTQFAMAGTQYYERHAKPENQVFLHWGDGHYAAIPMRGTFPQLEEIRYSNRYIESLVVSPNGREAEGYPRGSVRAELSEDALRENVAPLFSEERTPVLWHMLNGDLSRMTLAMLLTASGVDEVLCSVVDEFMQKFCLLLNNLRCLYFTKHICLHGFGFSKENLETFRSYIRTYLGESFAETVLLSPIQNRYRFLCGCTYAIHLGFYQRGGLS